MNPIVDEQVSARSEIPQVGPSGLHRPLNVLLLQGPVGGFFSQLRKTLGARGHNVTRFAFNAPDRMFDRHAGRRDFAGSLDDWREELERTFAELDTDLVLLFGACRPIHTVARAVALAHGIPVLCLEEGYIRPGYVTAEWGGNNAGSPVAGKVPDEFPSSCHPPEQTDFQGFHDLLFKSFCYYGLLSAFGSNQERSISHRQIRPFREVRLWLLNLARKLAFERADQRFIDHLETARVKYMVVALQVPNDLSLGEAAFGWTAERLVRNTIASLASTGPEDLHLVFKAHPLARGHDRSLTMIPEISAQMGVADRVHLVHVGSLGQLVRNSAGLITINSTSGLSAIAHGKPLMAVGRAVYANPRIATCANGEPDFDAFWRSNFVAEKTLRNAYLNWLVATCLLPGDYYAKSGVEVAANAIADKIEAECK